MNPIRVAVAALLLALVPSSKAAGWLQLPGVTGASTDVKHPHWIVIESFTWGVSNQASAGGSSTGRSASENKSSMKDIHITKLVDASSAALFQAVSAGKHFATAELDIGPEQYIFHEVMVSSLQQSSGSSGSDHPTESMTLNFASMEVISGSSSESKTNTAMTSTMATAPAAVHAAPAMSAASASAMSARGTVAPAAGTPAARAATLEAQLAPSLSPDARTWVATEGRTLSGSNASAAQLAASAHQAAQTRFSGEPSNVLGALAFLVLMDAAKSGHNAAQMQEAIDQVMGTTSSAAAGALVSLK